MTREVSDTFIFNKLKYAYSEARKVASGRVLEIGAISSMGIDMIADSCDSYAVIPAKRLRINISTRHNTAIYDMKYPPFKSLEAGQFDTIICTNGLEKCKREFDLIQEFFRLLSPKGQLIVITPNRKATITPDPHNLREYTSDELQNLLTFRFNHISCNGIYGDQKAEEYYNFKRIAFKNLLHIDILGIHKVAPKFVLRPLHKFINILINRRILVAHRQLTTSISEDNFNLDKAGDNCYDLFFIARQ